MISPARRARKTTNAATLIPAMVPPITLSHSGYRTSNIAIGARRIVAMQNVTPKNRHTDSVSGPRGGCTEAVSHDRAVFALPDRVHQSDGVAGGTSSKNAVIIGAITGTAPEIEMCEVAGRMTSLA